MSKDYEYQLTTSEAWVYLSMIRLMLKRLAREQVVVNSLKGGPILHRRMEICTEGWNLTLRCLEKPLPI
jgi:hypothetical protein